jgi:hypothetical protein
MITNKPTLCGNLKCQAHLQLAQCLQTNQKLQKSLPDRNDRPPRQNYNETNSYSIDSFKISPKPNTDGIGNCLQQPGLIRNRPKVYKSNFQPFIKFPVP